MDVEVQVESTQRIVDALNRVPDAARAGVLDALNTLRDMVRGRTPIGAPDRRTSGNLKRSWSTVEFIGGGLSFAGQFGTDVPYAETLELGLYHGVGPRTVAEGGGVYSRQAPGGMIAPIIGDEQRVNAVVDMVLAQIIKGLQGVGA